MSSSSTTAGRNRTSRGASSDKAPLTRTLDKKEVEDEVAETLVKLGHDATLHVLDGSIKSLHALARMECDLVFNLAESFAGNDTADYCIAAYLELHRQALHRRGIARPAVRAGQGASRRRSSSSTASTRRCSRARFAAGSTSRTISSSRSSSSRRARTDRSASSSTRVVSSIRELMERIDWLHANFDSPVLIEEYVEGREMYVGVIGNDNPIALPVVELDLSKLPEGTPRIAGAEVKWGKGTGRLPRHEVGDRRRSPRGDDRAAADDRGRRVPGARAARLRPYRHAPAARRPRRRHRGEPESLARVEGGIRAWRRERPAATTRSSSKRSSTSRWRGTQLISPSLARLRSLLRATDARPQIQRHLVAARADEPIDRVGRPRRDPC